MTLDRTKTYTLAGCEWAWRGALGKWCGIGSCQWLSEDIFILLNPVPVVEMETIRTHEAKTMRTEQVVIEMIQSPGKEFICKEDIVHFDNQILIRLRTDPEKTLEPYSLFGFLTNFTGHTWTEHKKLETITKTITATFDEKGGCVAGSATGDFVRFVMSDGDRNRYEEVINATAVITVELTRPKL